MLIIMQNFGANNHSQRVTDAIILKITVNNRNESFKNIHVNKTEIL